MVEVRVDGISLSKKKVGNVTIYWNYKAVEKNLGSFKFRLGVFPENNVRKEVDHQGKKIKIRNIGYRNRIKGRKVDKATNADILLYEKEKGRNWLLDSVDRSVNPNADKIFKLIKGFPIVGQRPFPYDFWKKNQQRCNGLVAIFRLFVESNPYSLHNLPKTVAVKGFDAYLRDSRQLQKSITAKIIYEEEIVGESTT